MSNPLSRPVLIAAAAVGGLLAQPALVQAQSYGGSPGTDETHWQVSAGYAIPSTNTANYLQGGWIVDGGFSYFPQAAALGIRGDLSYSSLDSNDHYNLYDSGYPGYGPAGFGSGYADFSTAAIGPVVRIPWSGRAHVYALAQIGASYVQLHSDQYYYGPGGICNQYYGFCGYRYGNSYDTTHLSWDVGVGMEIPLSWGQALFVEGQYRQIQTPSPIEYWPITVGFRF